MLRFEANLVGMHFRPPAKDVVNLLPQGCELLAQRQPENPYDVNAIQVLLLGFCAGGQHEELWKKFKEEAEALGQEEPSEEEDERFETDADISMEAQEALDRLIDPLPLGFICNGEKTGGKKADLIAPQMDAAGMVSVPCKLTFSEKGGPMVVIEADFAPPIEQDAEKALTESDNTTDHI